MNTQQTSRLSLWKVALGVFALATLGTGLAKGLPKAPNAAPVIQVAGEGHETHGFKPALKNA